MTKNPYINALLALTYIAALVLIAFTVPNQGDQDGNILVPIIFLSVFVLSAACMSCIFFFQPFRLYFDGKQKEAVILIGKTIVSFGVLVLALILTLLAIYATN